jgi:hypothetical protein
LEEREEESYRDMNGGKPFYFNKAFSFHIPIFSDLTNKPLKLSSFSCTFSFSVLRSSHFIADNDTSLPPSVSSSMPRVSDSGNSFGDDQESDGMYYALSFMRQMGIQTFQSVIPKKTIYCLFILMWNYIFYQ